MIVFIRDENYIRSPKWELMKMIGKSMTCIQNR